MSRVSMLAALLGAAAGVRIAKRGAQLISEVVDVPGRACDGRPVFPARVLYPSTGSDFPVFAFAHGGPSDKCGACTNPFCTDDCAAAYTSLLTPIAEAGYFVIALMSCPNSFKGGDFELFDSVAFLRRRAGFPIAYGLPATIAGHSGGGWATLAAASDSKEVYDAWIGLAVAMHPVTHAEGQEPGVPTMYWTGEVDDQANSTSVRSLYGQVASGVKRAFGVMPKAGHDEPLVNPSEYVYWLLNTMDCTIRGLPTACSRRTEMCSDGGFSECDDEF